ncbi:hypothetical protein F511_41534 [Dorcoceras hygrometricum]|uniref:Uncharacterized protein n=1 Tax=Dorcoceras hygrometricum TaxID=472368 RepID=A0A2Z7BU52_9LAMI|nr:hypothetical protein F511_41534 [Dorcoceras hygrometricum]
MESAVMTSAVMSSQSAVGNQQMKRSAKDEATSCWIISRWFSVDDVIGDVIIISRWFESSSRKIPAGSLFIQTQERSDVVEEEIQSQATVHQQMVFGDSDSKTMSFR